jgi:hypothetical protein
MTKGWKNKKSTKQMREGRGRKETRTRKGYSKGNVLSEGEEGRMKTVRKRYEEGMRNI